MIYLTKLKIGSKLYSPLLGDVIVTNICYNETLCIKVSANEYRESFTKEGYYFINKGLNVECLLFPSKECRDWNLYDFETGTIKDTFEKSNAKKVVFKGDNERGEDIIKYLQELGGYNKHNLSANSLDIYYFIDKNNIINCLDASLYHLIEDSHELLTLPPKLNDKDLIWCWDNNSCERVLRFYDNKNKCTFANTGERNGFDYDNYAPYIGEYPDWAKEAIKLLKD